MTNEELKMIIEKHEKWLKDQGGERADLSFADLYGILYHNPRLNRGFREDFGTWEDAEKFVKEIFFIY